MSSPRTIRRSLTAVLATALAAGTLYGLGPGAGSASAAAVPVGSGSYSDTRPAGASGPQNFDGAPVSPKVTQDAAGEPVPTNNWWSSLVFQRFADNPYSENMYGHPLTYRAVSGGLEIGYPTEPAIVGDGRQYEYVHRDDLTLGLAGLSSPDAKADSWSDWTVTPYWSDGSRTLRATIGHGLPFVYAKGSGGAAQITTGETPEVWADSGHVLGITVRGNDYALFAPTGRDWNVQGSTLSAELGGEQDYFSVAVLPSRAALDDYRAYAYSFVTGSEVSWDYDEAAGSMRAAYTLTTEPQEGTETGTLQALYRHQWLHTSDPLTEHTYVSPRGEMKVREGRTFSTAQDVTGVLPNLPDTGAFDDDRLAAFLAEAVDAEDPFSGATDTYWTGKALGRLGQLVPLAEQLGDDATRDRLLGLMKDRMEQWFTVGGASEFSYDEEWSTLTGYPASYGSDTELNDHHFHYGYFVMAAATIARYDAGWAEGSAWGGMVEMLVRDANNPSREDDQFPFLRGFDAYAGHGWAAGHQSFAAGNNQESSSESVNFSTGLVLWGAATGDDELRDLGLYLLTTESEAIAQYWFDADQEVFPDTYEHDTVGMVWGSGAAYSTWWTANPEEIHGINVLPVTGGSLHLANNPEAIRRNLAEMERENGGPAEEWRDILWQFQALADPDRAMDAWNRDNGAYEPEEGASKAHTYHWISTLHGTGAPDTSVTADSPTAAVFARDGERTYVAHNFGSAPRTVSFSDGATLTVPPRSTATGTGVGGDPGDPGDPDPGDPGDPVGSGSFHLHGDGTLRSAPGSGATTATLPSAGGANHDGSPHQPLVYELENVTGSLTSGGTTDFRLHVDAGTHVGNAPQARVSYDLTGNGTFDRVETYRYFATDPVPGWEEYAASRAGVRSATGTLADLRAGTVRLEIWNAIGNGPSQVRVGATESEGGHSVLTIPFE
ncbi:glycosyl hydrolase [Streptomyces sp. ACA25]|uniref:glycosyl hydrolase n=1 Tax=Streptomyces sp. ACA25 TaxID=3022596 RepID=UPI0023073495|nr:glycosyl hydrolase [Streptomyces sp. ACA25]MDB1089817.1 glycosyl hydrolase [Streptomyces sp. ACA25]